MNGIPKSSTHVQGRARVGFAKTQRKKDWMKLLHLALSFAALAFLSACAGSFEVRKNQAVTGHRTVQIMQESRSEDHAVHTSISRELTQRGFRLAESGLGSDVLKLGYAEVWSWDGAIHLRELHLQLVDA